MPGATSCGRQFAEGRRAGKGARVEDRRNEAVRVQREGEREIRGSERGRERKREEERKKERKGGGDG